MFQVINLIAIVSHEAKLIWLNAKDVIGMEKANIFFYTIPREKQSQKGK